MKLSQYFPSYLSRRFLYIAAVVAMAAVSARCGPSPEELRERDEAIRQESIRGFKTAAANAENDARDHPAYRIYQDSCAACHGQWGTGIGDVTGKGDPVKMKETMPPYRTFSIAGTPDITTLWDIDVINHIRNGNHLMPSFLDKDITARFNLNPLTQEQIESIANLLDGPFTERQGALMKLDGKDYGFPDRRAMGINDLEHSLAYVQSKLKGNSYRRKFEQTCGSSVCHGSDGSGASRGRKLLNYDTGEIEIVTSSPGIQGSHLMPSLVILAYGGRRKYMPSFAPDATERRAETTITIEELRGISDILFLHEQQADLMKALERRKTN